AISRFVVSATQSLLSVSVRDCGGLRVIFLRELARGHVAGVNHGGETENPQQADVHPADVELVPLRLELRRLRVRVMVVVEFFAHDPQAQWYDVPTRILRVEVAVSDRMTDAVDD